ncbi:MAG: trehalose-phosphatase [Thermomicrobiales bacterium]
MADRHVSHIKAAREGLIAGEPLVERCHECLRCRPAAIITDIDGTISEIAATPDSATVAPAAKRALAILATAVELVGVVTGRAAADGEQLVGLPGLLYIGNHGLEQRARGVTEVKAGAQQAMSSIAGALDDIRLEMEGEGRASDLIFENKRFSASIHYRLADDPEEVGRRLRGFALGVAARRTLRVTEGRFVVELRPQITVNKGTAVADLVKTRGLRGMIFLGDDVTDVDAFRVVRQLTRSGEIAGCVVAVSSPEVHPSVLNEADGVVEGVPSAIDLLTTLAHLLSPESTSAHVTH